jgi:hypothetical protein
VSGSGQAKGGKTAEELTALFAERNLNLPKTIAEQNAYMQQQYGGDRGYGAGTDKYIN